MGADFQSLPSRCTLRAVVEVVLINAREEGVQDNPFWIAMRLNPIFSEMPQYIHGTVQYTDDQNATIFGSVENNVGLVLKPA